MALHVGAARCVRVMVLPVDFDDDTHALWQQQQEVHAKAQKRIRPSLLDRAGVPVQPYFRQQR